MPNHNGADEQSSFLFINACIIIAVSAFIYRRSRQIDAEVSLYYFLLKGHYSYNQRVGRDSDYWMVISPLVIYNSHHLHI